MGLTAFNRRRRAAAAPKAYELLPMGGGWYRVVVNGQTVSKKSMRAEQAHAFGNAYLAQKS